MKCKKRRVTPLRLGARLHSSYHFDTTMMPYRPGCVNVQLCRLCCSVYSDSTVQRARLDVYNCGAIFILVQFIWKCGKKHSHVSYSVRIYPLAFKTPSIPPDRMLSSISVERRFPYSISPVRMFFTYPSAKFTSATSNS